MKKPRFLKILRERISNIDSDLRYRPVVKITKKHGGKKILEVGAGGSGISSYLHNFRGKIYTLSPEPEIEKTDDGTIKLKGDILRSRFKNNTFDIVISLDVIEHIRKKDRAKAWREMYRILKPKGIIICGFPVGSEAQKADKEVNNEFKKKNGKNHRWLKEHIDTGLPVKEDVLGDIRSIKGSYSLSSFSNLNVDYWKTLHRVITLGDFGKSLLKLGIMSLGNIHRKPTYREIFVVIKEGKVG
jgi:SAM-dependent methyltransferase